VQSHKIYENSLNRSQLMCDGHISRWGQPNANQGSQVYIGKRQPGVL